jgi:anaerobic selenocysteine-containing dehydrogenase
MGSEPQPNACEVKTTTCYMCACRCGIRVHMRDGKVRYIDGNPDHPVNRGVICGKGAAGLMQHLSPARLRAPMKRVGPRGSGEFQEITWDEALQLATDRLAAVRARDPRQFALFTGRDQSQALTGWFAQQFGTPNFAAHGGFCSVNMAAAGLYTFGGSFWEFGEPDWEHTRYFLLFGVAEDHASNPLKRALGKLKERGVKIVSINPVRTGYNAIADEWLGIRPGTDGRLVGALIHELLRTRRIDLDYLVRYTNAAWLVIDHPGAADHGLFARDAAGAPLAVDRKTGTLRPASDIAVTPRLEGAVRLADGRTARPAFELIAARFLGTEWSAERAAGETGVPGDVIRRIAAEMAHAAFEQQVVLDTPWTDWLGRRRETTIGRPVSMHAMRGISAHANGFDTCRLIHLMQILLGTIDCPGGFRYKPPFPRPTPPPNRPGGRAGTVKPGTPLTSAPLGFTQGPDDLLVEADGAPVRIDKAYSWEAPLAAHGLMHMVVTNAANHDPYPIDTLFMYMANMSWNSAMNVGGVIEALTRQDAATGEYSIPYIIYSDAYLSEMVPYADLILPDTTYLERWDCISLLDRPISDPDGAADAIRQPVVEPDRDVRPFQTVLLDLGSRLGLPGFVTGDGRPRYPGGYADYIVHHERAPGIGPLAGHRGADGKSFGKGQPNDAQLERYIEQGCFHRHELRPGQRYYKHANRAYLEWAKDVGFIGAAAGVTFQLYLEPLQKFRLAAEGHGHVQPPATHRGRILAHFDPIPRWRDPTADAESGAAARPFHAITQRPMHMYHSWGSQNAWLRQITAENRLYIHRGRAHALGIGDDDWVWIASDLGRVRAQVRLMDGVNPDTVWTWNAIGKREGAWGLGPGAPETKRGFLLNHLIADLAPARDGGYRFSNSDPVTGQAAWYDLTVSITRAGPGEPAETSPRFEGLGRVTR